MDSDIDIENRSEASSSGKGITLSPSGLPLPSVNQPASEEEKGVARATLTPGNLTLTNQTQDLASLNTDLSKANTQVDPFDIDELKAKQRSAAALSELLNMGVGDLSAKLGFAEGSPVKVALHAAVGAAVAAAAGGNIGQGALAGALSEIANAALQEVLKADPNLTDEQKSAITQWVAVAVGAAVGGQGGAAAALDNVNHNFLTHKQREELEKALVACNAATDAATCKADVSQRYSDLDFEQERQLDACRTNECVTNLLGDLNGDPRFAYLDVLKLQELGVSESVAQRLLSYQVMERWITGDASAFEQRIIDVVAGVSYCEDHGQSSGCFAAGQAIKYVSSTINDLTYLAIGLQMAAGAKKSFETEIKSVPDTVIVVDAAGKANVVIKGVEMSVHSAQRATERGISIENIKNAMDAKPFQYKQGGEWLTGYYDATTNTFVGVGSRITTVIKPKNPANYLANLRGQQ